MFELGKTLKSSRNKKYLTIEEVSSITKIKDHYIEALENEDVTQLPARVYAVGFLNNLADLYELSAADLILAFDNLKDRNNQQKPKKIFSGLGKDLVLRNSEREENEREKERERSLFESLTIRETAPVEDEVVEEEGPDEKETDFEATFSRIKKLSLDDHEREDDSISQIDDYIEKSKDELKTLAIKNELEKELATAHQKIEEFDDDYPTSKVMLEFEELMREEERFNTQKLRKLETERNINRTKNRLRERQSFNMEGKAKSGANMMVLILLIAAIVVLVYIIITALLAK